MVRAPARERVKVSVHEAAAVKVVVAIKDLAPRNKAAAQVVAVVPTPVEQPTRQLVWVKEPAVLAMVRAPARERVKVSALEGVVLRLLHNPTTFL
jgi:hypothetical protein